MCTVYSKTAGKVCVERRESRQTQISDQHCLALCPCDSKNLATRSPPPHPPRARQPSAGRTLVNPSLPACWGESMESHSYSHWLMFYRFYRGGQSSWVICVIAGGKGTIEVGCQSGGGRAQRMRNTLVCVQRLAHSTRTHKSCLASTPSHILCLMPAKQTHIHTYSTHSMNKTTLACALKRPTCTNMIPGCTSHTHKEHCICSLASVYPSPTLHTFLRRFF